MKRLLYFLIGFCIPFIWFSLSYADDCIPASCGASAFHYFMYEDNNYGNYDEVDFPYVGFFTSKAEALSALSISSANANNYSCDGNTIKYVYSISEKGSVYDPSYDDDFRSFIIGNGFAAYIETGDICSNVQDSDNDGIPDGLDAYPDTNSAYQFRIMTNYFDADGNCVGQLIVTSSGDYVLLGDLTAAEIEAGVSAGTYKSDFVNSPIWIDSFDLEDDSASDIYASGDSTTAVNSTTASGLTSSATTADANDLSTADGVTAGSTYDSGSDTDSSSLGKIVDNTAAVTSNQQALANYAKKQSELQATGNALLGQINDTLKNQSDSDSDSFDFDEQGAETAKSDFNNLSVSNYYSADDYNGTLTPEIDYDEAQDLEDVSWFTDFFSNNPLKTALNSSGFELSSGACEVSYTIDGWGTYSISLCEFSSAFETAGNLLFSFTSLLSLIIIAWR